MNPDCSIVAVIFVASGVGLSLPIGCAYQVTAVVPMRHVALEYVITPLSPPTAAVAGGSVVSAMHYVG